MVTKQLSEALEQHFSGLTFSQVLDQVPGSIFVKDVDGVLVACNQEVQSLAQTDVEGTTDYDIFDKKDADQFRENDTEVMESKTKMTFIETFRSPARGPVCYCTIKAPLFDNKGNVIGIIGQAVEIDSVKDQLRTL